jgi:hypothetical protein
MIFNRSLGTRIYYALDGCSYFCSYKREPQSYQMIEILFLCCLYPYYLEDFVSKTVFRKYSNVYCEMVRVNFVNALGLT